MNEQLDVLNDNYCNRIFFPFTDRFIQEYYSYNLDDIEYFLKLMVLYCPNTYITAANVWQSNITYQLYKNANILFDQCPKHGLIHLSTRKAMDNYQTFDNYFIERSEEGEHFLPLPDIFSLLDYQLYTKRNIAKELDASVTPIERSGRNVSDLISKNIMSLFFLNNVYLNENMLLYLQNKMISRLAIVNYIMGLPYHHKDMLNLIHESNLAYYQANAESNNADLVYPNNKYDLILYTKEQSTDFLKLCFKAGLSKSRVSKISFESIHRASEIGILKVLHTHLRYLVNIKKDAIISNLLYKTIYIISDLLILISNGYKLEYAEAFDINFAHDGYDSFVYNLNKAIIKNRNRSDNVAMNNSEISVSTMIEELNKRFSLEELKNICTILFDSYDQYPHSTKIELSRELCLACKRTDKISDLLSECLKMNSSFSVLPQSILVPSILIDWKGSNGIPGDIISDSDYEKIIESRNRFQSVSFLEKGLEIKERICLIKALHGNNRIRASGFLLKNDYILTNRHVFPDKIIVNSAEAIFGYDDCKNSIIRSIGFDQNYVFISKKYDLALAKLISSLDGSDEFIQISIGNPLQCMDDIIPIIQHPNGMPKQICIGHNSLKYVDDDRIQYLTDTMPGSSGSPVFNSNWELIGLHSQGGNICEPRTGRVFFRNEGINIESIRKFIVNETPIDVGLLL